MIETIKEHESDDEAEYARARTPATFGNITAEEKKLDDLVKQNKISKELYLGVEFSKVCDLMKMRRRMRRARGRTGRLREESEREDGEIEKGNGESHDDEGVCLDDQSLEVSSRGDEEAPGGPQMAKNTSHRQAHR
eukprot:8741746-Pyramimonas_sp.AAC.1